MWTVAACTKLDRYSAAGHGGDLDVAEWQVGSV